DRNVTGVQTCALPISKVQGPKSRERDLGPSTLDPSDAVFGSGATAPKRLVAPKPDAGGSEGGRPTICTFHSLCVRILRQHIEKRSEERRVGKECRSQR